MSDASEPVTAQPTADIRVEVKRVNAAKLNGHDPYAYLKDVLTRLPMHKNSQIGELLPHRWQPTSI